MGPVAGPGGLGAGAAQASAQPTTEPPSSSSIAAAEARPGPSVQAHPAVHPAADLLGQAVVDRVVGQVAPPQQHVGAVKDSGRQAVGGPAEGCRADRDLVGQQL